MTSLREQIVATYSEWCAFSATRSGSPLKSRQDVYPLIKAADFETLFGPGRRQISREDFSAWHKSNAEKLQRLRPEMPVGWTTKLLNVYLKTRVYVGGCGPESLTDLIHPPIDNGLWRGIAQRFGGRREILALTHSVIAIKDIDSYSKYIKVIDGCRLVAKELGCKLIEVEQLWQGTQTE